MGFLWEVGSIWVYLFWILIFVLQMLVAEMHRRWTWTAFALWTIGGVLLIPYVIIHGFPWWVGSPLENSSSCSLPRL